MENLDICRWYLSKIIYLGFITFSHFKPHFTFYIRSSKFQVSLYLNNRKNVELSYCALVLHKALQLHSYHLVSIGDFCDLD